jgi:hypothetical protein
MSYKSRALKSRRRESAFRPSITHRFGISELSISTITIRLYRILEAGHIQVTRRNLIPKEFYLISIPVCEFLNKSSASWCIELMRLDTVIRLSDSSSPLPIPWLNMRGRFHRPRTVLRRVVTLSLYLYPKRALQGVENLAKWKRT